jgi:hypothetical protein
MRPIGDLMKEMGFNKDAPLETQKAFIRHLISAANGVPPRVPPAVEAKPVEAVSEKQLSFDSEILGVMPKKAVGR